ncbi:MAG: hypothetical protein V1850_07210 [Candidatus Bathyarchaeota archaeon]
MSEMIHVEILDKDKSVMEGAVVSAQKTQAGFAIGVELKGVIQYLFQETYIKPGTKVQIKFPEFQLIQK